MKTLGLAFFVFILTAPLNPTNAQQAVVPSIVIKDSSSNIIGPVVGFSRPTSPVIRLIDGETGIPVFLEVRGVDRLAVSDNITYFGGSSCTGGAYHESLSNSEFSGTGELAGYLYSVARVDDSGSDDQRLFRSDLNVSSSITNFESFFRPTDEFCANSSSSMPLRPATEIMALDTLFPPPYTIH